MARMPNESDLQHEAEENKKKEEEQKRERDFIQKWVFATEVGRARMIYRVLSEKADKNHDNDLI